MQYVKPEVLWWVLILLLLRGFREKNLNLKNLMAKKVVDTER